MRLTFALILALTLLGPAHAQEADGIGYPTVGAAFDALKARSDVDITVQEGWTIINERSANTIWSFSPPGHPAHPSVVKRALVVKDGAISINMQVKCGADKASCDRLVDQFKELNEKVKQDVASGGQNTGWQASAQQIERVTKHAKRYFAAKEGKRYQEAYALMSPTQKKIISFDQFQSDSARFNRTAGDGTGRVIKKITWYRNPPGAPAGIYAAVDYEGSFANLLIHCGYVAWMEQADGAFLLVREEENSGDTATLSKVKPENLPSIRAQLHCRD